jgi:hypothetical protein
VSDRAGRTAIFCFDGLNKHQFELILKDMPKLNELAKQGQTAQLNSSPFTDAQPIWAEILTGEPWYRNGCAGYARPRRSLNHLQVCTEQILEVPIRLFNDDGGDLNLVVNVPILQPRETSRIWLSDGGAPSIKMVSPHSLLNNTPFQKYNPRPLVSIADAIADCKEALATYLECELTRLQCAAIAAKKSDWTFFLYRTSIFDQLAHLLGASFVDQTNLAITSELKKLLLEMDELFAAIFIQASNALLFSSFSHVRCEGIFSFNDALEKSKLLKRSAETSSTDQLRLLALAAAQSSEDEPVQPITVAKSKRYVAQKTLCASPVRGTIYLNSANKFDDGGKIDQGGIEREELRISHFFGETTSHFNRPVTLQRNPDAASIGPNFVFQIDGFELVETLGSTSREYDLPLSTHSSNGFVWSTKIDPQKTYQTVDIIKII